MYNIDTMEENTPDKMEDIILNLKLMSKIKQNDKMIVINKVLNVDYRFLQPFLRWYTCDSRNDTILFITCVVNKALDYMNHDANDPVYGKEIVKRELLAILPGLDNLSATYKKDNFMVSKIDLLKDKVLRLCTKPEEILMANKMVKEPIGKEPVVKESLGKEKEPVGKNHNGSKEK